MAKNKDKGNNKNNNQAKNQAGVQAENTKDAKKSQPNQTRPAGADVYD